MSPSARRILVIVAGAALAAACRAPKPPSAGDIQPAPHYRALFEPMRVWTYQVTSADPGAAGDDAGGDTATAPRPAQMVCRTDGVKAFRGGLVAHVRCKGADALLEVAGGNPLEGVWMANTQGLWHVRAGASPSLDNATLVIGVSPRAGKVDVDRLTLDDTEVDVTRDGDAWCTTHHQAHADGELHYTLCFTADGIRWGSFGAKAVNAEERRFVLAP